MRKTIVTILALGLTAPVALAAPAPRHVGVAPASQTSYPPSSQLQLRALVREHERRAEGLRARPHQAAPPSSHCDSPHGNDYTRWQQGC